MILISIPSPKSATMSRPALRSPALPHRGLGRPTGEEPAASGATAPTNSATAGYGQSPPPPLPLSRIHAVVAGKPPNLATHGTISTRNRPHIDRHLTGRCCQTSSQIIDGHVVTDVRRCGGPMGSKRRQKADRMAFSANGSPLSATFFQCVVRLPVPTTLD